MIKPYSRVRFEDENMIFDDRECHETEFPHNYFRSMRLRPESETHMITRHAFGKDKNNENAEAFSPWDIEFLEMHNNA